MKLLVTGKGGSGSWKIRGEQLGQAIGADVIPKASQDQLKKRDVTLIVKKSTLEIAKYATGKKVWDVIDHWPQPMGNDWDKDKLTAHILRQAEAIKASYLICATEQQRKDLAGDFTLYHHHRPNIKINPIRERVQTVGYEGDIRFLGKWTKLLMQECTKRGWALLFNPPELASCDIIVALRDFPFKGYATDNWKSNVKLANAQGSGTPIICNREAGYMETESGAEIYADTPQELIAGFDVLRHQGERLVRSRALLDSAYTLEDAAGDLKGFLSGL